MDENIVSRRAAEERRFLPPASLDKGGQEKYIYLPRRHWRSKYSHAQGRRASNLKAVYVKILLLPVLAARELEFNIAKYFTK